jgi:N utilization substance protein A
MNNELLAIMNYMEKEKGIEREVLLEAVEFALESASRKTLGSMKETRVEIDRETCDIRVMGTVEVVEKSEKGDDSTISVLQATKYKTDAKVGDEIEIEVTPNNFGRIAAQTAKQAIIQRIRQAEKDMVFDEYKDRVGEIVTGSVRQFNRGDIIVDLGRAQALMPTKERVPTEEYQVGDRIRAYVVDVQENAAGPAVLLSRSHPDFVRSLFKLEVSEIAEGIVEIKGIAREPGFRTKIAVVSHDEKVDPVGACVGMRGTRVKNIVRELSGEKIDIIRWSEDIKTYVTNALAPAKLIKVYEDKDTPKLLHVVSEADQLSLAIGKRGQNVRLTARLVGWKVDIQKDESEVSFEEKVAKAIEELASIEGIDDEKADLLVKSGFLSVEGILASEVSDVAETTGLDEEEAQKIYDAAAASQTGEPEESEE